MRVIVNHPDDEAIPYNVIAERLAALTALVAVLCAAEVRILGWSSDHDETIVEVHPEDWQLCGPLFDGPGWERGGYGIQLWVSLSLVLTTTRTLDEP